MRDIFDQDRAMTLSAVKHATGLVSVLFLVAAALIVLAGLGRIFGGHIFGGLSYIVLGLSGVGFFYLVIRLLGELLAALHRLNDRLTILGDDLRHARSLSEAQAPSES